MVTVELLTSFPHPGTGLLTDLGSYHPPGNKATFGSLWFCFLNFDVSVCLNVDPVFT